MDWLDRNLSRQAGLAGVRAPAAMAPSSSRQAVGQGTHAGGWRSDGRSTGPATSREQALEVVESHGCRCVVKAPMAGGRKGVTVPDEPGRRPGRPLKDIFDWPLSPPWPWCLKERPQRPEVSVFAPHRWPHVVLSPARPRITTRT